MRSLCRLGRLKKIRQALSDPVYSPQAIHFQQIRRGVPAHFIDYEVTRVLTHNQEVQPSRKRREREPHLRGCVLSKHARSIRRARLPGKTYGSHF